MNHHQLSSLDLGYISLLLDNDEIVDGFGNSKQVSKVVAKFAKDIVQYCEYVNTSFPPGYQLYVPDFWPIAFGRAKSLTNEDGGLLWTVSSFIFDVMKPLQASGVVKRISLGQFAAHGIVVEHEFGGSMYVWLSNSASG